MTPRDIACIELVELVTDYLEGALPPAEMAAIEEHLRLCDPCRRYVDQMRSTVVLLGQIRLPTVSEGTVDALLAAFRRGPGQAG